jgi:hypothetical protein
MGYTLTNPTIKKSEEMDKARPAATAVFEQAGSNLFPSVHSAMPLEISMEQNRTISKLLK